MTKVIQIINRNKSSSQEKVLFCPVFILMVLLLTNLIDGSHAEPVPVSVLQWLNLHLKIICQDKGEKDDDDEEEDDKPFYLLAGLPQLGANHCLASGQVPQSGIWPSFLYHFVKIKST